MRTIRLAIALGLLVAGCSGGAGASSAPVASTSSSQTAPFGFARRGTWHVSTDRPLRVGATSLASTMPLRSHRIADGVSRLGDNGILIVATIMPGGDHTASDSPADAARYIHWHNEEPLFRGRLSGRVAFFNLVTEHGTTVFLRTYFGTHRRSPGLFAQARAELRTLRLPPAGAIRGLRSSVPGAVPLVPMPAFAANACRSIAIIKTACPRSVPVGPYTDFAGDLQLYSAGQIPSGRGGPEEFNFSWWAENPVRPTFNRPPRFTHLVLWAKQGRLAYNRLGEPAFRWPNARQARRLKNGEFARDPQMPESFGTVTWCHQSGTLTLVPLKDGFGIQGGHLIFHWHNGAVDYALGLHSWEPFTETAATLHSVACSALH